MKTTLFVILLVLTCRYIADAHELIKWTDEKGQPHTMRVDGDRLSQTE